MKRYLAIAALAACGNKGATVEKATEETETFIGQLNKIVSQVDHVKNLSYIAGPNDRCHYYGEAITALGELRTMVTAMPLRNHAPGLGNCVDAVRADVQAFDTVLSKDIGGITAGMDLCRELGIMWADRQEPAKAAVCVVKKSLAKCVADAKAAGATTKIREMSTYCDGDVIPGDPPAGAAPPMAPKAPAPPAPVP